MRYYHQCCNSWGINNSEYGICPECDEITTGQDPCMVLLHDDAHLTASGESDLGIEARKAVELAVMFNCR